MMHGASSLVAYAADVTANSTVVRKRTIMRWNATGADIAAGTPVSISADATKGTALSIKPTIESSANEDSRCCGGAVRLIPTLTWGEVQVEGIQSGVAVNGTMADGDLLDAATTAARLNPAAVPAASVLSPVAIARSVNSGGAGNGTATVQWVNAQRL